jgi:hypothetical protein
VACAPWNPIGCAASLAKTAAGDAFSSIAHDFGHMADSAVNWLWAQTNDATAVRLDGTGFHLDVGIVATIAVTVAVGLFVIQVMASTIRRDPGGLGRAARGLVVAFVGAGIAIGATNVLLAAVDALSAGVVQAATGQSLPQLGHAILTGSTISQASSNPAAIIIFSMAALVAVAFVWAALTVRKVLIVISAVFAPLAFAGSLADITASWVRRWIEVTVALIVSKLILVIIFVVGLDMLVKGVGQAGSGDTQRATQAVSGLLVLAVAGFAPWLALKLVHWSGDQFHQIHGLASASAAGAYKAVQAPQKAMPWVTGAGAGAGALAGAGATRAAVPAGPAGAASAPAAATGTSGSQAGAGRPGGDRAPSGPLVSTAAAGSGQVPAEGGSGASPGSQPAPAVSSVNGHGHAGDNGAAPSGPASTRPAPSVPRTHASTTAPASGAQPPTGTGTVPASGARPSPAPPWPTPATTREALE